jgi:hypothetical protein
MYEYRIQWYQVLNRVSSKSAYDGRGKCDWDDVQSHANVNNVIFRRTRTCQPADTRDNNDEQ